MKKPSSACSRLAWRLMFPWMSFFCLKHVKYGMLVGSEWSMVPDFGTSFPCWTLPCFMCPVHLVWSAFTSCFHLIYFLCFESWHRWWYWLWSCRKILLTLLKECSVSVANIKSEAIAAAVFAATGSAWFHFRINWIKRSKSWIHSLLIKKDGDWWVVICSFQLVLVKMCLLFFLTPMIEQFSSYFFLLYMPCFLTSTFSPWFVAFSTEAIICFFFLTISVSDKHTPACRTTWLPESIHHTQNYITSLSSLCSPLPNPPTTATLPWSIHYSHDEAAT